MMPGKFGSFRVDHTGKTFHYLTVIGDSGKRDNQGRRLWTVKCKCGNIKELDGGKLVSKNTKSCGCWKIARCKRDKTTHGEAGTRTKKGSVEWNAWRRLKVRCRDKREKSAKYYLNKGITVCKRWDVYENFLKDMGRRPLPGWTIDRKNNDKGYCKSNCRWVSPHDQAINKSTVPKVKYKGVTRTIREWAAIYGFNYYTIRNRWRKGERGDWLFRPQRSKHKRRD